MFKRLTAAALASIPLALGFAPLAKAGDQPEARANASCPAPEVPAELKGLVSAFVEMLNDPTRERVAAFEKAYGSQSRHKAVSDDERARRLGQGLEERGKVAPTGVHAVTESGVTLLVDAANGEKLAFEFQLSATEPGKLEAVMISPAAEVLSSRPLDAAARAEIVEGAAKALEEMYVYPEVASRMAASVRESLAKGAYDQINSETAFALRLTQDLRGISHDKHLGVRMEPKREGREDGPSPERIMGDNYAFRRVEVLPGNIGYLKFDAFVDSPEAKARASQAMGFVENAAALIVDLRSNGGGSPEMIRYITSYLFDSKTHLNDMVDRNGKVVEEYWTLDDVPGKRLKPGTPVFVLTSGRTFSGAEEFSYNLKNLKRATIIGETTGGGAHPVQGVRLTDRFVIGVPFMRAQNPVSKTNWEGTGVEPDVSVPAEQALDKALELARDAVRKAQPEARK